MKPLFTIEAGEFLVDSEIERKFRRTNVWIPTKDTGIDLLVSNSDNTETVSLQVKSSRDYLVTLATKDAASLTELRACGWWTPIRQKIEKSRAKYWVFVLIGFANRSPDFIIIKPDELLERLDAIPVHRKTAKKFQIYFWVTKQGRCFEARGLNRKQKLLMAKNEFEDAARDFSKYLNKWKPIEALNG
jgi:hypothetical protein